MTFSMSQFGIHLVLQQREERIRLSHSNEDTKDEERRKGWVVEGRLNVVPSAPVPRPRHNILFFCVRKPRTFGNLLSCQLCVFLALEIILECSVDSSTFLTRPKRTAHMSKASQEAS
jgi:hypothetical protein